MNNNKNNATNYTFEMSINTKTCPVTYVYGHAFPSHMWYVLQQTFLLLSLQ